MAKLALDDRRADGLETVVMCGEPIKTFSYPYGGPWCEPGPRRLPAVTAPAR